MNIFKRLKKWVFGISDDVLDFAKGLLVTLAENPEIRALAAEAVKAVEEAALAAKGNQKLAQAQNIVIGGLKAKGLPIVMNAINIAIEAAVANLRKG